MREEGSDKIKTNMFVFPGEGGKSFFNVFPPSFGVRRGSSVGLFLIII